jgi:subtilase family serine protease
VDRKIILWSIALFFGCSILFRAIDAATAGSSRSVSLTVQAAVLAVIVLVILVIARRRS